MLYHTTRQSRTERGIEQEEEGDGQEEEERERVGEEGNGEGDGGDEGEGEEEEGRREHAEAFREFWAEVVGRREWRERCRGVGLCGRCEGFFSFFILWFASYGVGGIYSGKGDTDMKSGNQERRTVSSRRRGSCGCLWEVGYFAVLRKSRYENFASLRWVL